jgi:hypothetical protein
MRKMITIPIDWQYDCNLPEWVDSYNFDNYTDSCLWKVELEMPVIEESELFLRFMQSLDEDAALDYSADIADQFEVNQIAFLYYMGTAWNGT